MHPLALRIMAIFGLLCSVPAYTASVQLFDPQAKTRESWIQPSSQALQTGDTAFNLSFNYVRNPLEFGFVSSGTRVTSLVDAVATLDARLAVGVLKFLDLEAGVPLHIHRDINVGPTGLDADPANKLGDVTVRSTITLISRELRREGALGVGLQPFFTHPLSQRGDFLSQASWTTGARVIVDKWISRLFLVGMNAGFRYRHEREQLLNLDVDHELLAGVHALANVSERLEIDALADISMATRALSPFQDGLQTPIEMHLAFRKIWPFGLAFTLGGGRGLSSGYGAHDFRVFTGLSYQTPRGGHVKDSDTSLDRKPQAAPTPPSETPMSSLIVTVRNEAGEALPAEVLIKQEPGKLTHRAFTSAITKDVPAGTYHISVQAPGYLWGFREVLASPSQPQRVEITLVPQKVGSKIEVFGSIQFDFNEASLRPESYPILDHVVEVLRRNPGVKKIRIDAHTDSTGSDAYNMDLSIRRAASVESYLRSQGVEAQRLSSQGFGESLPIDTNETPEGQARNRRVEFVVVESDSDEVKGSSGN